MDGKAAGETPLTIDNVKPGRHVIAHRRRGRIGATDRPRRGGQTLDARRPALLRLRRDLDPVRGQRLGGRQGARHQRKPDPPQPRAPHPAAGQQGARLQRDRDGRDPGGRNHARSISIRAAAPTSTPRHGRKSGSTARRSARRRSRTSPIRLGVREIVFKNPQFPERKQTVTITRRHARDDLGRLHQVARRVQSRMVVLARPVPAPPSSRAARRRRAQRAGARRATASSRSRIWSWPSPSSGRLAADAVAAPRRRPRSRKRRGRSCSAAPGTSSTRFIAALGAVPRDPGREASGPVRRAEPLVRGPGRRRRARRIRRARSQCVARAAARSREVLHRTGRRVVVLLRRARDRRAHRHGRTSTAACCSRRPVRRARRRRAEAARSAAERVRGRRLHARRPRLSAAGNARRARRDRARAQPAPCPRLVDARRHPRRSAHAHDLQRRPRSAAAHGAGVRARSATNTSRSPITRSMPARRGR